jgi:copper chaperone CopZ
MASMSFAGTATRFRSQSGAGRWKAVGMILLVLLLAGVGVRFFAKRMNGTKDLPPSSRSANAGQIAHSTFQIEGLDCLMCAAGLQRTLGTLPGMRKAEVSYQDKQATVEYDPSVLNRARIEKSIQDGGFKIVHPSLRP